MSLVGGKGREKARASRQQYHKVSLWRGWPPLWLLMDNNCDILSHPQADETLDSLSLPLSSRRSFDSTSSFLEQVCASSTNRLRSPFFAIFSPSMQPSSYSSYSVRSFLFFLRSIPSFFLHRTSLQSYCFFRFLPAKASSLSSELCISRQLAHFFLSFSSFAPFYQV